MTDTVKTLAQLNPSATTLTDFYTVPAATSATISSITICNQSTATTFRVSIAVAGSANNVKQYIYYDTDLAANRTYIATIGITLAATDVVRVYAGSTNLSFNLFGVEVT